MLRPPPASALRAPLPRLGAERMARGAGSLHAGQAVGSAHSAIGRLAVKGPQVAQA
jgi:hypothetical protein